jgi:uncharacterized LabA/DUF88 family protein
MPGDRVAVLIDCDNISHRWAGAILGEAAKHGTLGIKRGYGDWGSERLKNWRTAFEEYAVQPIQQSAYTTGKNSTDFALVIDAMDLLYSGNVDMFCIVSSDSDFTRLAMRLRESGKQVYGIGARKTPSAFQKACDRFTYVEVLVEDAALEEALEGAEPSTSRKPAKRATPSARASATAKRQQQAELTALLLPAIEANAKDDGWAALSGVGSYVVNTNPTFDSRNYGYSKLSNLVADLPQIEVREEPTGNGTHVLNVRRAQTPRATRTRKRS